MALVFTQTDNVSNCDPFQACAPAGTNATPLVDVAMVDGGTPGTVEETFSVDPGTSVYGAFFQSGPVEKETWEGGSWTVNINVTSAQKDLSWSGVWICRVSGSGATCTSHASIGSETVSKDISAGGVFSKTVTGVETSRASATDTVYVVCEFSNANTMTSRSVGILPDQDVASPITAPAVESVTVTTGTASNVTDTTATLNGSLDELAVATSADVWFEWRAVGDTVWNTTPVQTMTATGPFSADLTGLTATTDYEFRAQASSTNATSTGATNTFTTTKTPRTVAGTVTLNGTGVGGATVHIINPTPTPSEHVGTVTTATDGSFSYDTTVSGKLHVATQHDDGTTKYNAPSYHSTMPPDPAPAGSASYELRYDGPGIDLTMLTDPAWEPQGVCYAEGTDRWYVAEVTDTTTPSTIHEFTADGVATANTFQFASATPNPNHANALAWHDGHLWCAEYNSDTVYKIDWAAKAVVGSFTLGNGVVDPDKLGAIAFVPTSTGSYKLLASMWGSTSTAAYLVNYKDAIADGTATGNIYRTLTDAIDPGRLQGMLYDNGRLYITHDALPNGNPPTTAGWGSYPVLKLAFPYADSFAEGDPLIAGRYRWEWLTRIPYNDPIQGIGLNPSNGTFWVCSESLGQIHSGAEKQAVNHLPDSWNDWNLHDFAGPNNEWQKSIELNNAVASGKRDQHIYWNRQPADVEGWLHDDLADVGTADEKRAYVSVAEPENAHNTTENALAINSAQSATEYVSWNSTDSWHLTGVTRPASPQWIKFRWQMDGSQTTTAISKDHGATWTTIRTYTHSATALGVLIPQVSTGTPAYLGPFTITPR